ncbi:hypothetical protein C8Q77DRAFT_1157153 [Trametes polyzona]|nr:hypothetical protein C8Q77DRAFT_1157153 [Trametes polyzona]
MRCFAILALAAALSTASAAQVQRRQAPQYPACALPCIASADFGNCDPVDDNCLCHNQAFISSTTTCITSSCSGSDLQQAESAAQGACAAVGVTLSAPAPSATAPASSGSSTEAPSSTTSTAPSQTSNAASARGANALAALAAVGAAAFVL